MEFSCFNGMNNCEYCCSCHSKFKAKISDEKRRIYNQALDDVLGKIRAEMHATAEMHEDGVYYLRDEWVDEIVDKYAEEDKV